jgi:hypothetical protein
MSRYLCETDVLAIFKILTGGIPNARYTEDTVKAWMMMFGHIDRLQLLDCAKQFMLGTEVVQNRVSATGKFFPTVSEMNVILKNHQFKHPHWKAPKDKKDERALWFMAINGISDPGGLTMKQTNTIYEVDNKDPEEKKPSDEDMDMASEQRAERYDTPWMEGVDDPEPCEACEAALEAIREEVSDG